MKQYHFAVDEVEPPIWYQRTWKNWNWCISNNSLGDYAIIYQQVRLIIETV